MQDHIQAISETGVTSYSQERIIEFQKYVLNFNEVCTEIALRKRQDEVREFEQYLWAQKEQLMRELPYSTHIEFYNYVRTQVRMFEFCQDYQLKIDEYNQRLEEILSQMDFVERVSYEASIAGDRIPERDLMFLVQLIGMGYTKEQSLMIFEELGKTGELSDEFKSEFPLNFGQYDAVILLAYNASSSGLAIQDVSTQFNEAQLLQLMGYFQYLKVTKGMEAAYKHNNPSVNNSNLNPNNRLDAKELEALQGKGKGYHGEVGTTLGTGGNSSNVKFGSDVKSSQKLMNQMSNRGWTKTSVKNTIDAPYTTRSSTNLATGNSATVYYNQNGSHVIVDNVTNEIVQVSDALNPSEWISDPNIINPYKP